MDFDDIGDVKGAASNEYATIEGTEFDTEAAGILGADDEVGLCTAVSASMIDEPSPTSKAASRAFDLTIFVGLLYIIYRLVN